MAFLENLVIAVLSALITAYFARAAARIERKIDASHEELKRAVAELTSGGPAPKMPDGTLCPSCHGIAPHHMSRCALAGTPE